MPSSKEEKTTGSQNNKKTYWLTADYWATVASTLITHKHSPKEKTEEEEEEEESKEGKPKQEGHSRANSYPLET